MPAMVFVWVYTICKEELSDEEGTSGGIDNRGHKGIHWVVSWLLIMRIQYWVVAALLPQKYDYERIQYEVLFVPGGSERGPGLPHAYAQ